MTFTPNNYYVFTSTGRIYKCIKHSFHGKILIDNPKQIKGLIVANCKAEAFREATDSEIVKFN